MEFARFQSHNVESLPCIALVLGVLVYGFGAGEAGVCLQALHTTLFTDSPKP